MQPWMVVPCQGSDQADEWIRLGVEAQTSNRLPDAQRHYNTALRIDPRNAIATQNLAIVFSQSNLINEALLTIERAVMLDPDHAVLEMNFALMCLEAERIGEALEHGRKAVAMAPKGREGNPARYALATVCATAGIPQDAIPLYNEILDTEPNHPAAGINSCFVQTLTDATPKDLLAQRMRWHEVNRFKGEVRPHDNDRNPDRPLRVGYVSGDFKVHSASFIFASVLFNHSKDVAPYFYSTLPVDPVADVKTKRFQEVAGDRWRDVGDANKTPDDKLDELIRRDKIDILVDLAAHTNGGRLPLFTRKPAPVQVTAWGFAHGAGCGDSIDYFFADPIAVPQEDRQHYAEKVVDLPCIVSMLPPSEYNLKGTSVPPMRKNGHVTFAAMARYEKMSERCLRDFAEILRRVPDSRLLLKDNAYRRPYSIKRIVGLMEGIEPERLLFSIATSHADHLLAMQQADVLLDPYPHGGGVVALESLYMGVPMLTLYGKQPSGRTASSVLTCMKRMDWIAGTSEEYVAKAVEWAGRTKELAEARKTLRDELMNSPVIAGYVEAVEKAYREIWRTWCRK